MGSAGLVPLSTNDQSIVSAAGLSSAVDGSAALSAVATVFAAGSVVSTGSVLLSQAVSAHIIAVTATIILIRRFAIELSSLSLLIISVC